MELSTIMPTPNTSDVREITFKEKPMAVIPIMARTTEHTIEIPMIAAAFTSPQNNSSTTMERTTAKITVLNTSWMELSIISLESLIIVKCRDGFICSNSSMTLIT